MRTIVLLTATVLLSGCLTMKNIAPGTATKLGDSEAIVVIGMHQRYRVHLQLGRVQDGVWHMAALSSPEANVFPEHGYIVVKLPMPKDTERFSIPMVLPDGIGLSTRSYIPCAGTTAPSFTLKAGAVNYVGHISYALSDEAVSYELSQEQDAAAEFLASAYPELASSVHLSPMTSVEVAGTDCHPTIYIPIYVPS